MRLRGRQEETKAPVPAPSKQVQQTWLEAPKWHKNYQRFGDRLDFLSPEGQHAATGKLRILPARGERKRYGSE